MKKEFSAGGIVLKNRTVLLIKNPAGVWTFPKGNIEKGEKPEETAVREIMEETGIRSKVEKYLGDINYWYSLKGTRIFKTVKYYLMKYMDGKPSPSWEVRDAAFFELKEANRLLKYKGDKEIFKKALSVLGLSP